MTNRRVLLLAGSSEATEIAHHLAAAGHPVTASLAGLTRTPAPLPCPVRTGGFGGAGGLAQALRDGGYGALIDATHPNAGRMPRQAAAAAHDAGVPRLRVVRPPWSASAGDRWHETDDLAGAARLVGRLAPPRVLLAIGRQDLEAFAGITGVRFVVRSIERPDPLPLAGAEVITARPPFTLAGELDLLSGRGVDTVVTRNSGGEATAAKLAAARSLGLPVIMVRRPPVPPGPLAPDAGSALRWLGDLDGPMLADRTVSTE